MKVSKAVNRKDLGMVFREIGIISRRGAEVARLTHDQKVAGSIPAAATTGRRPIFAVEHVSGEDMETENRVACRIEDFQSPMAMRKRKWAYHFPPNCCMQINLGSLPQGG